MDIIEQLEYPLPILSVETEKMDISITVLGFKGSIKIRNLGGSQLSGFILADSLFVSFETEKFELDTSKPNAIEIPLEIKLESYKIGNIINSRIIIISNGGEQVIPLKITVVPHGIATDEGYNIASLKEFASYVKKYPKKGRLLFISNEFQHWLLNTGYKHMKIYDRLVKDSNKERAVENFLLLNKLKSPCEIIVENKEIIIEISEERDMLIKREINFRKSGHGFLQQDITVSYNSDWLKITSEKLALSEADENGKVIYEIDPSKIKGKYACDKIIFSESVQVNIKVIKKPVLYVWLDKKNFNYNEIGKVFVENKTKREIIVDVIASDNFVKFNQKRFVVNEMQEIPFNIRLSHIQRAQLSLKKQPFLDSEIYLTVLDNEKIIHKTLKFFVGNLGDK